MRTAVLGAVAVLALTLTNAPPQDERVMAITIDDLPTASVLGEDLARARRTTNAILAALARQRIPAIGFVNERKLEWDGAIEPARVALLQQWLDAGLELGNHTYSHLDLHRVDPATFAEDVARGEPVTRRLLERHGRSLVFFRHPFLHTGASADARRATDAVLRERGYTVAPVTIDNYDYIFAAAYDRTVARADAALAEKIRQVYLEYLESVVSYYEQQSMAIVGRPIAHTMLLHAHALNGETLDEFTGRMRRRGYRFVPLSKALEDAAYRSRDEFHGQAGISWLHRWALTSGKKGIYAGEPVVPEWIARAAELGGG